tara:strand:- start:6925 stop:7539 length:615 start_codon:yes stop_codon:yes gene_type:complete
MPEAPIRPTFDRFNAPPPGHSLTDEPGKWAWEKPPEFADPAEALQFVIEKAEEPENEENLLRLMASGAPIEAIVNTICFGGFMQGQWTPDCAEILKPPVTLHFLGLALENDIPATVFNIDPEKKKQQRIMPDEEVLALMEQNRPDMYEGLMSTIDVLLEDEPVEEKEEKPKDVKQATFMEAENEPQEPEEPTGFMGAEEEEILR